MSIKEWKIIFKTIGCDLPWATVSSTKEVLNFNETEVVGSYLFSNDFYSGNCKDKDLYASFYATYGILNSGVWEYTFDTSDTDTF